MIIKKIIFILLAIYCCILPMQILLAQDSAQGSITAGKICYDPFCEEGTIGSYTGLSNTAPTIIVARLINWALSLLGIVALVLIIYAGFKWMLAAGEEDEIEEAQDILKGAIIGLAIILASYGITHYVFTNLVSITNEIY